MKFQLLTWAILALMAANSSFAQSVYTPKFVESEKSLFKIKAEQKFTFGYLEVPENRSVANSQTIRLPVYIFKSRNPHPKPDPIIYTVGGPGSTTMPSAPYMEYYPYLDDRDFILFEQRGTYYAQPHLDCPEWGEALYRSQLPDVDQQTTNRLFAKAAHDCRQRLIEQGIDLNGYHTREIAADIVDLRKALGIEAYNLLTISYSTKIAQVLLRDDPEGIRSVVMDSPLPLEVSYDEESVANLLEAITQLLADCASDADCDQAFPDLKLRFFDYLQKITENPLELQVKNPSTAKLETFYLSGKDLLTVFTAASTNQVSRIPLEMEKLLNNDFRSIQEQLANLLEAPQTSDGMGMRLSVWCAEEYPFASQEVIARETDQYPATKGLSPAVFEAEVCEIWSVKSLAEIENQPIQSNIPVLLLSGEYDHETPPKWAAQMQKNLPNSHHLIFQGWKHTVTTNWGNPCARQVANAFFNDPSREPSLDCFQDMQKVKFDLE